MDLLFGHDATVMAWARRINPTFHDPKYAIGILQDGTLRGAVMIVEQTIYTADLGIVSEVPPGPGIARKMFRLLFNDLDYTRVEITIERTDKKSRKAAPRWGFKFDGTAHDYWGPGVHALRFVMLREHCPFLKVDNGKQERRSELRQLAGGFERSQAAAVQRTERADAGCLQSA